MTVSPPRAARGPLLLLDIGGYTSFLQAVATDHADDAFAGGAIPPAYEILTHLLDGLVEHVAPPLTLAKLEGDAVFAYAAEVEAIDHGGALLTWLSGTHAAFEQRLDQAKELWTCTCAACIRIDQLDLKAILHVGRFILSGIAGREELTGPDVVLAHRLLKSSAAEVAETPAYALLTAAAVEALDVPTDRGRSLTETIEHYAPVDCVVFDLQQI